ncbi:uncharacterized protein G2W53_014535 [Senna tora]|uniref:Uncharacterized protein n=1 Tax=Senna tora TaxID=362788 RepID=A0A835C887_9FABA|nr:uncharacterized protein G2W53_014535 [Senna tora]
MVGVTETTSSVAMTNDATTRVNVVQHP